MQVSECERAIGTLSAGHVFDGLACVLYLQLGHEVPAFSTCYTLSSNQSTVTECLIAPSHQ